MSGLTPEQIQEGKRLFDDKTAKDYSKQRRMDWVWTHRYALLAAAESVATLERERDNWIEDARRFSLGEDFYRDIVRQIGEPFGVEARTSDDGSIQDSVLALKVPELVASLRAQLAAREQERDEAREIADALLQLMNGPQSRRDDVQLSAKVIASWPSVPPQTTETRG